MRPQRRCGGLRHCGAGSGVRLGVGAVDLGIVRIEFAQRLGGLFADLHHIERIEPDVRVVTGVVMTVVLVLVTGTGSVQQRQELAGVEHIFG